MLPFSFLFSPSANPIRYMLGGLIGFTAYLNLFDIFIPLHSCAHSGWFP